MKSKIDLDDYLEYVSILSSLDLKHKNMFGDNTHPDLPKKFTENFIRHIFDLSEVKIKNHGDAKLAEKDIYFEIKATGANVGGNSFSNNNAHYVIWAFFNLKLLTLEVKLINMKIISRDLKGKKPKTINFNNIKINDNIIEVSKIDLKLNKRDLTIEFQKSKELLRKKLKIR